MFIHFAFAGFKNYITAQTETVINKIIEPKRLKFRNNPEFIPVFQPNLHPKFKRKKVGQIALESFMPTKDSIGASLADSKFVLLNKRLDVDGLKTAYACQARC